MSLPLALLLFPVRPRDAARAARGRPLVAVVGLFPGTAFALWLVGRGCAFGDALAAGGALTLLVAGLALGGILASLVAERVTGVATGLLRDLPPAVLAASWAVLLPAPLSIAAGAMGMTSTAALFVGFVLLLWGIAIAHALLVGDEEVERGHALVAACLGVGGSLAGLWGALVLAQATLVFGIPSAIETEGVGPGEFLLLRVSSAPGPGQLVCLGEPGSREVVFARIGHDGRPEPIGRFSRDPSASRNWDIRGRVFFRFAGRGWGNVVATRPAPPPAPPR